MTQQVSIAFEASAPPPAWNITVIADLLVGPSPANPDKFIVTVPGLASWSVIYAESLDGYDTEADATAAGLELAEAQGWSAYPATTSPE